MVIIMCLLYILYTVCIYTDSIYIIIKTNRFLIALKCVFLSVNN